MKKVISVLLALCIALTVLSTGFVTAFAEGTKITGTDVSWSYDYDSGVLTFSGSGAIPDYNSYKDSSGNVKLVYPWANLKYISVVFGEGITGIGNYALCYSTSLKSVIIPDTVSKIGKGVFLNCTALETAKFYGSASISDDMFAGCSALKNLTISGTGTAIGKGAFYNCISLAEAKIPEDVTLISEDAFSGCTGLKKLTLSDTVKKIDGYAFYECEKLSTVVFGSGLEKIGENAFGGCIGLTSLEFNEGLKSISPNAFNGNRNLSSVTFPDSLEKIGDGAFNVCPALSAVTIGGNIQTIGAKALGFGSRGAKVEGFAITGYADTAAQTYANTNSFIFNSLGSYADGSCGEAALWSFDKNTGVLTISGSGAMYDYTAESLPVYSRFANKITGIVIGDEISAIGAYAFYNLSVNGMTIPETVTAIGENAIGNFEDGIIAEGFSISGYRDSAAQKYAEDNGIGFVVLNPLPTTGECGENVTWSYNEETKALTLAGTGAMYDYTVEALPEYSVFADGITEIVIGDGISAIGAYAFYNMSVNGMIIPEAVTAIGENAIGNFEDGVIADGFSISGYRDSAAQKYAEDNGINFVVLNPIAFEGKCGENVTWSFDGKTRTLALTGTGATDDYTVEVLPEFAGYGFDIKNITVGEGITKIGNYALVLEILPEKITFGESIAELGEKAFGFVRVTVEDEFNLVSSPALEVSGYNATPVKAFADENGFTFISLDPVPAEFPSLAFSGESSAVIDGENMVITYFCQNTEKEDFCAAINSSDYDCAELSADVIGTGTTLTLQFGEETKTYTFIVPGDLNGDGTINSADALKILNHAVESETVEGITFTAGDINADGIVNSADALEVLQIAVGQKELAEFLKTE